MMKKLALTLLFGILGVGVYGQTIKSLGYNTTNGQVVYNGTNVLTFGYSVKIGSDPITINGTTISWGGVQRIDFEENRLFGELAVDTIIWDNPTNAATTRANLGLGATWLTNTNVTNFRTAIGLGATNSVTFAALHAEQDASSSVYTLTIGQTNTGFKGIGGGPSDFVYTRDGGNILGLYSGGIQSLVTHTFSAPVALNYGAGATAVLQFGGIDAATGAAISRTNLGLGGGITTNRTFVSYNGTNYTTKTVTISNGIITGWTQ
jgi:hypothetical protein